MRDLQELIILFEKQSVKVCNDFVSLKEEVAKPTKPALPPEYEAGQIWQLSGETCFLVVKSTPGDPKIFFVNLKDPNDVWVPTSKKANEKCWTYLGLAKDRITVNMSRVEP